jgi:ankyrin repeat protein
MLLQAGHDANAVDMHKATPLHRAAASGSLQTVSLLPNICPCMLH